MMKKRTKQGYPEIGLGAWQLGADWGEISDAQANNILNGAAEAGIRFIDTADVYGAGLSERRIGAFLKTRPESFFIATKLGRLHGYPDGYSLELFRRCVLDSCSRLGVAALDLVQLHCVPTSVLREGHVFEWLRQLQHEGLIRHWGASVESTEEAELCMAQEGIYSLQIIFNIFRQHPIKRIFSEAKKRGIALIIRLPLASGLLSGKFDYGHRFDESDHRHYNRDGVAFNVGETFGGLPYDKAISCVQQLAPFLKDYSGSLAQKSIRWILDHEAVSVVIAGCSKVEQVYDNVSAAGLSPFPTLLHQKLEDFVAREVQPHIRGPI